MMPTLPEWPSEEGTLEWVNEVTAIAPAGSDADVERGERFVVEQDGEAVEVKVVKVTPEKSVLERVSSGFLSYADEGLGARVRDATGR